MQTYRNETNLFKILVHADRQISILFIHYKKKKEKKSRQLVYTRVLSLFIFFEYLKIDNPCRSVLMALCKCSYNKHERFSEFAYCIFNGTLLVADNNVMLSADTFRNYKTRIWKYRLVSGRRTDSIEVNCVWFTFIRMESFKRRFKTKIYKTICTT